MFKIKQEKVNNFLALNGEKLSGYEPPARIILEEMKTQVENNIYKMIQGYGISVDKEELIKALRYDRRQYQKGYADAVNEFHLLFEDKVGYHFLSNNSWLGDIIDEIKKEMLGG